MPSLPARRPLAQAHWRLKPPQSPSISSSSPQAKRPGFNPETLESWFVPGLFLCGEVLDVDGDCGGYNLQWAWASGRLAGKLL